MKGTKSAYILIPVLDNAKNSSIAFAANTKTVRKESVKICIASNVTSKWRERAKGWLWECTHARTSGRTV